MLERELIQLRARIEQCGREALTFGGCPTLEQIEAWERALGATLPEHYREFILQIGDGFHIDRQHGHLRIGASKMEDPPFQEGSSSLVPFPLQPVIYDNYMHSCGGWEELTGHEKIESDLALALGYEDWDNFALILTGPKRGEVWQFSTFSWNPQVYGLNFIDALHKMLGKAEEKFERENSAPL